MFDQALRKTRLEVNLIVVVAVISLSASSLLIADASSVLAAEPHFSALTAFRVCELIVALAWLFLSAEITREIVRFRKTHRHLIFSSRLKKGDESQSRSEIMELIRDTIAFYRTYYSRTMVVLALAIATGLALIIVTTSLSLSIELLVASALYVYIHLIWGRKLLKVKDNEKKLSDMLGGPVDT
jgi:hypothetical protein